MRDFDPDAAALIVVDARMAFDEWERSGASRNHPFALDCIVRLLAGLRRRRSSIFHIRHRGASPGSLFRGPACEPLPGAAEKDSEPVLWKTVHSAFIGTDLEARLRAAGLRTLVICGATNNHCVETTARMASNLDFDVGFARDATWTYDRAGPDDVTRTAAEIEAATETNPHEEFAEIVQAANALELSGGRAGDVT